METNYTLKKLIRGGTLLLFFLAFMLSGSITAFAQEGSPDKAMQTLNVVFEGDGGGVVTLRKEADGELIDEFLGSSSAQVNANTNFVVYANPNATSFVYSIDYHGLGGVYNEVGVQSETFLMPATTRTLTVTFEKKKVTVDVIVADQIYDGTEFRTGGGTLTSNVNVTFAPPGTMTPTGGVFTAAHDEAVGTVSNSSVQLEFADIGNATYTFTGAGVGTKTFEYDSGITLAGGEAANYTLVVNVLNIPEVLPRPSTLTFAVADKEYDGNTSVGLVTPTLQAAVPGDTPTFTMATKNFEDAAVAVGKTVILTGFELDEPFKSNYNLIDGPNVTVEGIKGGVVTITNAADINQKELTLTNVVVEDVVFDHNDGTPATTLVSSSFIGVVGADDVGLNTPTAVVFTSNNPGWYTVTITTDGLVGTHSPNYTIAVAVAIGASTGQVLPPAYAVFGPSILDDGAGNKTLTYNVDVATDLTISFNKEPFTGAGGSLMTQPLEDLATYFRIGWRTPTSNETTLFSAFNAIDYEVKSREVVNGMYQFTIVPVDGDGEETTLAADSYFRLEYLGIHYKDGAVYPAVPYRLDMTQDDDGEWGYFENVAAAYEFGDKHTTFKTAGLPKVKPYGLVADICDADLEISVRFINPVKYRVLTGSNPFIPDTDLSHRFVLVKRLPGEAPVRIPFEDYTATPGGWQDANGAEFATAGPNRGPTKIVFDFDLEYNTEYAIFLLENANGTFGFRDMVTDEVVFVATATGTLNNIVPGEPATVVAIEFQHQDAPDGDFWLWQTAPLEVDILVQAVGQDVDYAKPGGPAFDFNIVDLDGPGVTHAPGWVSNTVTMAGTNSPSITLTAVPTEGQKFVQWDIYEWPGNHHVGWATATTVTLTLNLTPDNCGTLTVTYRATFAKNEYLFALDLDTDKGSEDAGTAYSNTPSHGDEVVLAIMPEPGFEVIGWDVNWPAGVASITYPLPDQFVLYDVPATYSATLIGPNLVDDGETVYMVTPTFAVFNPNIHAQTFYAGAVGVASLTVTHDAAQEIIAQRGYDDWGLGFGNLHRWGFKVNSVVTLTAHPIVGMCEVDFVEWLKYDYILDEWVSYRENRSIDITMGSSLVLRAIYDLKEAKLAALPGVDKGMVTIEYDGDLWESEVDDPTGIYVLHGDVVTITVYPEENLTTYGWTDDAGNPIADRGGVNLITTPTWQFQPPSTFYVIGDQRFSDWRFKMDVCDGDLVIHPVIDWIRREVKVTVVDHTYGTDYEGGTVKALAGSDSEYEGDVYTDFGTGFRFSKNVYEVRTGPATATFEAGINTNTYGVGRVPHGDDMDLKATPAEGYGFAGWWNVTPGLVTHVLITSAETLSAKVEENMVIEARFVELTNDNMLYVHAAPEADAGTFTYAMDPVNIHTLGGGPVDDGVLISIPKTETSTITIEATPADGWQYVHELDSWSVVGVDTYTLEPGGISFVMPDDSDVEVTCTFVPQEHDLHIFAVGYNFGPDGTVTDFEFAIPAVGTATATADGVGLATITHETVIRLKAGAFSGFRFVNWMFAEHLDIPAAELTGFQILEDAEGDYSIDKMPAGDVTLVAVFARAEYPVYELTVQGEFSDTRTSGKYPHGAVVKLESDNLVPGYDFDEWDIEGDDGFAETSPDNPHYLTMVAANTVATAKYELREYLLKVVARRYVDDETPIVNGGGTIQIGTRTPTVEDEFVFDIEDDPILLTATEAPPADGFTYEFKGWYHDAALTQEVIVGGEHHTDPVWIWNPALSPDHTNLFARFDRSPVTYEVKTLTALGTRTTLALEEIDVLALTGAGHYEYNDPIRVEAPAGADSEDLGYEFVRWATLGGTTISEGFAGRRFNHTVKADTTFVAVYKKIPYTVTLEADPAAGGKVVLDGVEGTEVTGTRYVGDVISVNAIAEDGWKFVKWIVGADEIETAANDITLAPGDLHLIAVFEEEFWTVTVAVVDENDDPIEGATVTLGTMVEVTDADGEAIFEDVTDNPAYDLEVDATGYNTWKGNVSVDGADKEVDVAFQQEAAPVFATAVTAKSVGVHFDEGTWRLYVDGAEFADNITDEIFVVPTDPEEEHVIGVRVWTDEAGYKIWSAVEPVTVTTLELGDVNAADGATYADLGLLIEYMTTPAADFDYEVIADAGELFDADDDVFIWDAADINDDGDINVLDVVGLVNILNPAGDKSHVRSNAADMHMGNGLIRLDSDGTLAGVQFELIGSDLANATLEALLPGMQIAWRVDGNVLTAVVYSPDNQAIDRGVRDFIRISGAGNLDWGTAFGANLNAHWVDVNTTLITTGIQDLAGALSVNVFPNPSDGQFTSRIEVEGSAQVTLRLYDLSGRVINQKQLVVHGTELVTWNENLTAGMYILRMYAENESREVRILINK